MKPAAKSCHAGLLPSLKLRQTSVPASPEVLYSSYSEHCRGFRHKAGMTLTKVLLPFAVCLLLFLMNPIFAQQQTGNEVALDNDLIFSENWFTDLGKAKENPEKVLYLDLSLKKNKTFPPEILTFKNVERLYLSYNYWYSIPDEIGTLANLKILDLSGNYYLNYLPKEGLSKFTKLEQLIIKDNKLAGGEIEKIKKLLPNVKVITE